MTEAPVTRLCIYSEVATCKRTWAVQTALFKGHLEKERDILEDFLF